MLCDARRKPIAQMGEEGRDFVLQNRAKKYLVDVAARKA